MSSASTKSKPITKLKLLYPFKWDEDEEIAEVEFKRPKGKDMKKLGQNPGVEETLEIASKISGMTPSFFLEMDGADVMRVIELVNTFLDPGQEIGKTA